MPDILPLDMAVALKVHPVADLFPMLPPDEAAELAADIEANGLLEPLVIYQGELLDGRNRLKACVDADVAPASIEYSGNDPIGFIISKNIKRRQLSPSMRAMIAADIARLSPGRPKQAVEPDQDDMFDERPERDAGMGENPAHGRSLSGENSLHGGGFSSEKGAHGPGFLSTDAAANQMQVGARSVKRAKVVRDAGCEGIAAAVASGDLSLRAAERLSRSLSREEQEQLAAQGVEAMQQRADRLAKAATKIATPKPDEVLAALAARIADAVPLSMAEVNDWRGRPPRLEMRQEDGLVLVSVDAENRAAILARINEGSDAGDDDAGA